MDAAASELVSEKTGRYEFPGEAKEGGHLVSSSADDLINYYEALAVKYPLVSVEAGTVGSL